MSKPKSNDIGGLAVLVAIFAVLISIGVLIFSEGRLKRLENLEGIDEWGIRRSRPQVAKDLDEKLEPVVDKVRSVEQTSKRVDAESRNNSNWLSNLTRRIEKLEARDGSAK